MLSLDEAVRVIYSRFAVDSLGDFRGNNVMQVGKWCQIAVGSGKNAKDDDDETVS